MSADTRIWNRTTWDRYHFRQLSTISKRFLEGEMTTTGMFEEKDRVFAEFEVYVRARMSMYAKRQLTELEF